MSVSPGDPGSRERCSRCDVEMTLQPMGEGSAIQGWYCPCCRSRMRTPEMIQADAERRAAEQGITVDELYERSKAFINTDPLPPEALEAMRAFVRKQADEWEPVCPHDTENPWR